VRFAVLCCTFASLRNTESFHTALYTKAHRVPIIQNCQLSEYWRVAVLRLSQNCTIMWLPALSPNARHGGKSRWFMLSVQFAARYSRCVGTSRFSTVRLARAIRDLKSRLRFSAICVRNRGFETASPQPPMCRGVVAG
jgi:hypothetical protein